ncbi:MAG: hypothetical protein AAF318_11135 [Pseudomonadota bacterium]
MKQMIAIALLLVTSLWVPGVVPQAAAQACLSQSAQRDAISSGRAIRPRLVRDQIGGQVVGLRLCETSAGLVWQATAVSGNGEVRARVFDARSGRQIR